MTVLSMNIISSSVEIGMLKIVPADRPKFSSPQADLSQILRKTIVFNKCKLSFPYHKSSNKPILIRAESEINANQPMLVS